MRISTQFFQQLGVDTMLSQQAKLSRTQEQLSTGRRILTPSDDPVASSQSLQWRQVTGSTEQYQANADFALNRLALEDSVLDAVDNSLQRVRELAIQGNNATQTNQTRGFMAGEIRQLLDEILGLANSRDATGDYMFAGSKNSTEPFAANTAGGYTYFGDQGQRFLQVGPSRQVADGNSGAEVFQLIRNGNGTFVAQAGSANTGTGVIDQGSVVGAFTPSINTALSDNGYRIEFFPDAVDGHLKYRVLQASDNYTTPIDLGNPPVPGTTEADYVAGQPIQFAGARVTINGAPVSGDTFKVESSRYQDIFTTLDNLADALESDASTALGMAELNNAVNRALSDLDLAMDNINTVRATVGGRLNAIEDQKGVNDDQLLQAKQVVSALEDLDYAEAVSRLNLQMAGLQAAQQTYIRVQGLSLFDYLR